MEIALASNNAHKAEEIRLVLQNTSVRIYTLRELNIFDELPETGNTLDANALQKAMYVHEKYGINCISDDTGLEIEALGGRPGVYSARYAGEGHNDAANIQKVLEELQNEIHRKAQFRTVIALILDRKTHLFEGKLQGKISLTPSGNAGFGYDPIFIPEDYSQTIAELGSEIKSKISHRSRAIQKLLNFLKNTL